MLLAFSRIVRCSAPERPARRAEGKRSRQRRQRRTVILVAADADRWSREIETVLTAEGYKVDHASDLESAARGIGAPDVDGILVASTSLGLNDVLALRSCRQTSPGKALVVVTSSPPQPVLKRALEGGATAFLSWPAPIEALRLVLRLPAVEQRWT